MLLNGPLLIIIFAIVIALKYKGKWYKASLVFSGLALASLIYSRTIHVVRTPDPQCFSNIQACSQGQANATENIIRAFILALLLSAVGLLLSYKKPVLAASKGKSKDASRNVLITISLIFLIGTFIFIAFLFYALSQI